VRTWRTRLLQGKAEPQNDDELEALRKQIPELQDPPTKMKLLAEHHVHQLFELRPCIGLEVGASSANVAGVEVVGNSDADEDGDRLASIIGDGIVTLISGVPVRSSADAASALKHLKSGDVVEVEPVSRESKKKRTSQIELAAVGVPLAEVRRLRSLALANGEGESETVWPRAPKWERSMESSSHSRRCCCFARPLLQGQSPLRHLQAGIGIVMVTVLGTLSGRALGALFLATMVPTVTLP
jgi:hypothetical protein